MEEGTQDQLTAAGWEGSEGEINKVRFKYELCPACYSPAAMVGILSRVKKGLSIVRQADGTIILEKVKT